MPDLCPSECAQRDRLARELLSSWTRQAIVAWLNELNNPEYREDMRTRLNRVKKEPHP